jgi:hypothetical protein
MACVCAATAQARTRVLAVLADAAMARTDVSPLLPVLRESARLLTQTHITQGAGGVSRPMRGGEALACTQESCHATVHSPCLLVGPTRVDPQPQALGCSSLDLAAGRHEEERVRAVAGRTGGV